MNDIDSLAISGRVNAIIVSVLDCDRDDVVPAATMDDLKADSLDVSDIIMQLEDEYGIDLGWLEVDYEGTMALTVSEIAEAVEREVGDGKRV